MKNVQLIFAIVLMNGLFLQVSAQEKKWEIGSSLSPFYSSADVINSMETNQGATIIWGFSQNLSLTRVIANRFVVGSGIGITDQNYRLYVDKNVHQISQLVQLTEQPDFTKEPYNLKKIKFKNTYLNVPIFVKFRVRKQPEKIFHPFVGMRIENYFLCKRNTSFDYKAPGDNEPLEDFIIGLFGFSSGGSVPLEQRDIPTEGQKEEVRDFYEQKNRSYTSLWSFSGGCDFQFKQVDFGAEVLLLNAIRTVHENLENQEGLGLRFHFGVRF